MPVNKRPIVAVVIGGLGRPIIVAAVPIEAARVGFAPQEDLPAPDLPGVAERFSRLLRLGTSMVSAAMLLP